jgi:hypothetical protein
MRLATGICGKKKKFCVIDTEAGRAKHYADAFNFDHGDLMPPFRPKTYVDAIMAADKEGYSVIIVDSVSHVWAGDGGILDWQEEELTRMAGDDWKKRESCKMAAWVKPKMAHKQMVQKLLQVRAHLILCFRAEPKVEMRKGRDGRMEVVAKESPTGLNGWMPVCEKNLPYELTASFLLMADNPGIPYPIKLQEQHKALFSKDKHIDEEAGKRIAEWAAGGSARSTTRASSPSTPPPPASDPPSTKPTPAAQQIKEWMNFHGLTSKEMLAICRNIFGERIKSSTNLTKKDFADLTALFDGVKSGSYTLERADDGPPVFVPVETAGSGEEEF